MLRKNQSGITIIELVITLTILAMLTTVITASKTLISQARIRSAISQIQNIESAIYTFQLSYGYKPGDFPNGIIWGANVCELSGTDGLNGNGDGKISDTETVAATGVNDQLVESYAAWCHLQLADLSPFEIKPLTSKTVAPIRETNLPPSFISESAVLHVAYDTVLKNNVIYIADPSIDMSDPDGALTPTEAYNLDNKMDNKRPDKGRVRAYDATNSTDLCLESTGKKYDLSVNTKSCFIKYMLSH